MTWRDEAKQVEAKRTEELNEALEAKFKREEEMKVTFFTEGANLFSQKVWERFPQDLTEGMTISLDLYRGRVQIEMYAENGVSAILTRKAEARGEGKYSWFGGIDFELKKGSKRYPSPGMEPINLPLEERYLLAFLKTLESAENYFLGEEQWEAASLKEQFRLDPERVAEERSLLVRLSLLVRILFRAV